MVIRLFSEALFKINIFMQMTSSYKIQDTRCIFRASEATLSGFSSEKGHKQVLLKSIKHMQVHIIQYRNAGDDEIESLGLL